MTGAAGTDPFDADAAALAALGLAPARLRRLLQGMAPDEAWSSLADGRHPADPEGKLRRRATPELRRRVLVACRRAGVSVGVLGTAGYPGALAADHEAPAVAFTTGDLDALEGRPRVAVVGTRTPTPYGLDLAAELGAALAEAGVVVVSGLAHGIDAAAHGGALHPGAGTPVLAVPGAPVDAPVPASVASLRAQVLARGVTVAELPPGAVPARWNFAVRNRIVATLAHLVVVVEAHPASGTLHTVRAADVRGVPVGAFPGSVRSPASRGTNGLIADGAAACLLDIPDVFQALELAVAGRPEVSPPTSRRRGRPTPTASAVSSDVPGSGNATAPSPGPGSGSAAGAGLPCSAAADDVLAAIGPDPATLDQLVLRSGRRLGDLSLALDELVRAGLAREEGGWWWRR